MATKEYICDNDWTVREITPSEGYLLDATVHKIGAEPQLYTVEHNQTANDVTEQVVKGNIAIIKHTDNGETQIETPESGAEFAVYLKAAGSYEVAEDTERDYLTCDENGFAQTKDMPYGIYTVHQVSGWGGSELMPDFDVFISQNGATYRYLINNAPFNSFIKIVKQDAETGKTIPYAGAGFKIYDPDGNPVTMTFTYPTPTTIDVFYTNAEGSLVTPEKLPFGKGYCSGIKLLKGFNDLKTKYPSLAAEWSEKNLSLTPDAVNEKSTKNVWWKCNTCGYEWKAVVKARVKGGMCPVCAERAVLQGYNDLGTTDPYLLSEWDYEKNSKWTPSNVSRNSMKVVWWKCGAGHSYRAKITDRTIEQKGCPQCEAEFQQALPQMLIMMYGAQNGITVKSNSDSELGMRLVAYLPELHCAVDIAGATVTEKREQSVKAHICQSNRLGYYLIKRTADASQMAAEIKTLFIRNHIYLHTDSEKDVQVLRERFLEWKYRNACKLNGKY